MIFKVCALWLFNKANCRYAEIKGSFQTVSQWNDLPFYYDRVAGEIFHTTSIKNFRAIIQDQEIKANRGERGFMFEQSARSYAKKMGYVALFDFFNCPEEKIRMMTLQWPRLIAKQTPAILLLLDRGKLGSSLVTSAVAALKSSGDFMSANYHIPHVEAWYPERIPLGFCVRVLKIDWSDRKVDEISLSCNGI